MSSTRTAVEPAAAARQYGRMTCGRNIIPGSVSVATLVSWPIVKELTALTSQARLYGRNGVENSAESFYITSDTSIKVRHQDLGGG